MTDPTTDEWLVRAYDEMRVAARRRVHAYGEQSIQATELVNEVYLRLIDRGEAPEHKNDLIRLAARAMRDILVERARSKSRRKRGGDWSRVRWESAVGVAIDHPSELLELDEALLALDELDPDAAEVVRLKFYAGLGNVETAQSLGVATATVDRRWAFARAWLRRHLREGDVRPT